MPSGICMTCFVRRGLSWGQGTSRSWGLPTGTKEVDLKAAKSESCTSTDSDEGAFPARAWAADHVNLNLNSKFLAYPPWKRELETVEKENQQDRMLCPN